MRLSAPVKLRLLPALCGLLVTAAQAQAVPPARRASAAAADAPTEQNIERIRHEDRGSRIEELRVGGETRSITVKPKGNVPAYQVAPEGNNRNPAGTDRNQGGSGQSGWKLLNF